MRHSSVCSTEMLPLIMTMSWPRTPQRMGSTNAEGRRLRSTPSWMRKWKWMPHTSTVAATWTSRFVRFAAPLHPYPMHLHAHGGLWDVADAHGVQRKG